MACHVLALTIAGLFHTVTASDCKSGTIGKDFAFGISDFASSSYHDIRNIISLDITNVSPNDTRARLQIPFFNNDTYLDIPPGEKKTIVISATIQRDGTFKDSRGIKISSKYDLSVLVTNAYNNVNNIDTYNILPIAKCGKDYIISSYVSTYSEYGSVVLVAGAINNTNITFLNGTNVLRSDVLNAFEVLQYECYKCDLTELRVISNENVYVVAGSTHTGIPDGTEEYIAAEMLPTSTWSYSYIVPPVLPKSAFMMRIISQSSFDVAVSNLTRTYKFSASAADQYFGTEAVVATADRPFSVTQYGVNYQYDSLAGDPFMAVVPAVEQYINNYMFTVPRVPYGSLKHYVAVIVPKAYIDGLILDGKSVQMHNGTGQIKSLIVPAPFDNYAILTFSTNEGYHHFYHSIQSVNFAVFVYGHGLSLPDNWGLSYGFYAGYNLKGDCIASTSTSTSTSTTTSPSTTLTQSTSTHLPATTPSLQSGGQMCYNCEDLSHIDLCDTVKHCSEHEVCFVERYVDGGQTKYKAGCLQQNMCEIKRNDSMYSDGLCFECCHGDYCNNNGCGDNGIPDRDRRGPICFDCQHVSSPEECVKIAPCDSHQVCRIEEYKWFDHSHFKLGCGHGLCDPVNRMSSHVLKRATPVCHACCTDDFCNRNCTSSLQGQTGSVIVG